MSHNFKPGDPAIITVGLNGGCCVRLISFHTQGRVILKTGMYTDVKGDEWRVEGDNLVARAGSDDSLIPVQDGLIHKKYLMPLRGDFAPEQQKSREVDHVHLV